MVPFQRQGPAKDRWDTIKLLSNFMHLIEKGGETGGFFVIVLDRCTTKLTFFRRKEL
jgi:hypothetical protein